MRILALDPATKCGYAHAEDSGVWDLKSSPYESTSMRLLKFRAKINQLVLEHGITFIVYEKPGGRHFNGIRSHANLEGVLLEYCLSHNIDFKGYSASEIKKFATGKGNAKKEDMVEAATEKYGEVIDDNHADALHLFHLAVKEYKVH